MTAPQDPYAPGAGQPTPGAGQQPGYGPAYGSPDAGSAPAGSAGGAVRPRRNGLGVAALVVGILAVLTCVTVVGGVVLGLVAIALGALGRGRARRGEADNGGLALTGALLGLVGIVLSGVLVAIGVSVLNSPKGKQLQDCVRTAQGDQARVQQCQQEYAGS